MKRPADVVLGGIAALVALPIVATLAVVGAVVFRGNPFFVQSRVGKDGRDFRLWKLRSLPPETPRYADKYALQEVPVCAYGRFIRRFHLDELPQLFHVPTGRMSLVGPRPEMRFLHEQMPPAFAEMRVSVRPGCTGLWQLSPAVERLICEAPEYDCFYVAHRSWRLDAWILWRTVLTLLRIGRPITLAQVPGWARARRPVPVPEFGGAAGEAA